MEASPAGKPTAVKTKRVVTAPVAGIPAAPMLDTADVTLQIKHRYCTPQWVFEDPNIKMYDGFFKSLPVNGAILYT